MQAIYTGVGMEERRVVHGRARCERGGAARLYGMTLAACGRWRKGARGRSARNVHAIDPFDTGGRGGDAPAFREKAMLQEFAHTVASRPSRLALLLVACACLAPAAAPAQDWVYGGPPVIVMPPPAVVVPAPHYDPCRDGSINWGRP